MQGCPLLRSPTQDATFSAAAIRAFRASSTAIKAPISCSALVARPSACRLPGGYRAMFPQGCTLVLNFDHLCLAEVLLLLGGDIPPGPVVPSARCLY